MLPHMHTRRKINMSGIGRSPINGGLQDIGITLGEKLVS